jgi:hypothetical protein
MIEIEDQIRAYAQAISARPDPGDVESLTLLPQGEGADDIGSGRLRLDLIARVRRGHRLAAPAPDGPLRR